MAIKISKTLIKKLPKNEQDNADQLLWNKSGELCFLCGGVLNEAGEDIVPDHDIPESDKGETILDNLNLTHVSCNSFKRNHPTVDVRPYLKLVRLMKDNGGFLKYDQAAKLLNIEPKPIQILSEGNNATFTFADNSISSVQVYSETNKEGDFKFCFVEVPANAIFNDDECQPRTIKEQHLWQIYNDINRNPLHEAPACRLKKDLTGINLYNALMFDGQHKTLAFWVDGREKIVIKVYIDITKDQAIRLVNSVQSKIKKLPLSPFELAAKMSDEWQDRVSKYETEVGTENASEDGFINWVDKDEKARAKSAFTDALYQSIIDSDNLEFKKTVLKPGQKPTDEFSMSETTFKNKVLKQLLHTAPLKETFLSSQKLRSREADIVIKILNTFYQQLFKPDAPDLLTPQDELKRKRLAYQVSLAYVMTLIRSVFGKKYILPDGRELIDKEIDEERIDFIENSIKRILDHPVWVSKEQSKKMQAITTALIKNHDAAKALSDVGLKPGYGGGLDELDATCLSD